MIPEPKLRGDGRWAVKVRDPENTKRRQDCYGKTREECIQKVKDFLGIVETSAAEGTVIHYYETVYMPSKKNRSRNWRKQIAWAFEKWFIPWFGTRELSSITRNELIAHFSTIGEELDASSLSKVKICIGGMFIHALDDDDLVKPLQKTPVRRLGLPEVRRKPHPKLTLAEARLLLAQALSEPHGLATCPVILGLGLGLRRGELLATRTSKINADGVIHIDQQLQYNDDKKELEFTDTKTTNSDRYLPIPEPMREALRSSKLPAGLFLCRNTEGGVLWPKNVRRELEYLFDRAGVSRMNEQGNRATPHALRRTFTSIIENQLGCPRPVVKQFLGHAQATVTDGYSEAEMDVMRRWANALWSALVDESAAVSDDKTVVNK